MSNLFFFSSLNGIVVLRPVDLQQKADRTALRYMQDTKALK